MIIANPLRWALLAAIVGSIVATAPTADTPTCADTSLTIKTRQGEVTFFVEVAARPDTRAIGLMNRTNLAPDAGMLFVYPPDMAIALWMKNTLIPLDMLFIDDVGVIRFIKKEAQPHDLTPVPGPNGIAARAALELNGGRAEALGIEIGDRVQPVWAAGDPGCAGM